MHYILLCMLCIYKSIVYKHSNTQTISMISMYGYKLLTKWHNMIDAEAPKGSIIAGCVCDWIYKRVFLCVQLYNSPVVLLFNR